MTYRVVWELDVDADSPQEAAQIAREIQLDSNSRATVFQVNDEDCNLETVDLLEIESNYEARIQAYERQGMTRSNAQSVVDAEDMQS